MLILTIDITTPFKHIKRRLRLLVFIYLQQQKRKSKSIWSTLKNCQIPYAYITFSDLEILCLKFSNKERKEAILTSLFMCITNFVFLDDSKKSY